MSADSHWSEKAEAIPTGAGDCREPALIAADEVLHLAWTHGRTLKHTYLTEGSWSDPQQIAVGGQAALGIDPDGVLHCLFSAQMLGNIEIYHTTWDGAKWLLPEVVSRTSGVSMYPALAIDADGSLHATWADTTPGHSAIYYGTRDGVGWKSKPIPNGSGSHPAIAIGRDGEIYVAWQSRLADTERFAIFCTIGDGVSWDLPANVSANSQRHAIYPSLTVTQQGVCHLVWQEDLGEVFGIKHADRYPNGWSVVNDVSQSGSDCRLPRICAARQGYPQVAWAEGQVVTHRVRPAERDAVWWQSEGACDPVGAVSDLAAVLSAKGELHVVWAAYGEGDTRRLHHIRRVPVFKPAVFMPLVAQDEEPGQTS